MTQKEVKKEVGKVLQAQVDKGVKKWGIACSFIHFGFREKQIGEILGLNI